MVLVAQPPDVRAMTAGTGEARPTTRSGGTGMNGQRLTSEQAAELLARATAAQLRPPAAARSDRTLETAAATAQARGIARASAPGGQSDRAFPFEEHQDGSGI
jgi:hypothetical protein